MGLFQPNRDPAPWPGVHRSCCKGMSACCHSSKHISEDLIITEMKKIEVKMNKPIYLSESILDINIRY